MEHLFISYSRRNEKYVSAVAQDLRSRGIEVWQDISGKASGIPYSTKWFEVIQEALFSSAGAVIFVSEEWRKSGPCKKELELIEALDIPYKEVIVPDVPTAEGEASADEEEALAAEKIAEWSAKEVYGDVDNMDRVWMLSMIWNQRTKYGALAGIPHFRKRADSKEFLKRLERCRAISERKDFPERLERCRKIVTKDDAERQRQSPVRSDEVELFLKKARRKTIFSLVMRPVAVAVVLALIAGSVAANWIYSVQRDRARQHLEALQIMEEIRDLMDTDETQALALMGQESLEFGEYVTLLYEAYAQILSREFPAERYEAGTEAANKISSLPEQTSTEGYTVELSDTSGTVRVYTDVLEDGAPRMIALSVSDQPDHWAAQDGFLAVAAGKNAYVYDLSRGNAAVRLYGCSGKIEKLRFDENGKICAVTDTGEVCVWENPIRRAICSKEEVPQMPADREQTLEQFFQNGKIRLTGSADGMIRACDVSRDCLIWQCTAVTEPVTDLLLEEDAKAVYALGRSETWYRIDIPEVLLQYDSKDVAGQRARYREAITLK